MFPYIFLILIFGIFSSLKYKGRYILRGAALFLLILFIGLRNEIGTDYLHYKEIFEQAGRANYGELHGEIGWFFLNKIVRHVSDNFKVITLIHAGIIVFLLHVSLKRYRFYTFSFILFILANSGYTFIVNGMRQGIAIALFFYSWRYIQSREGLKYWTLILLGTLFHISILFVAPLYWLANKAYDVKFYLIVQTITLVFFYTHVIDNFFIKLLSYTNYSFYVDSQFLSSTVNSGISFVFRRIGSVFVLFYYGKLLRIYPKYVVYFNMFFLMVVTTDLFANIFIFARIIRFFSWSELIVIPVFVSSVFKTGESFRLVQSFVLAVSFALFIYIVYTDTLNNLVYTF